MIQTSSFSGLLVFVRSLWSFVTNDAFFDFSFGFSNIDIISLFAGCAGLAKNGTNRSLDVVSSSSLRVSYSAPSCSLFLLLLVESGISKFLFSSLTEILLGFAFFDFWKRLSNSLFPYHIFTTILVKQKNQDIKQCTK